MSKLNQHCTGSNVALYDKNHLQNLPKSSTLRAMRLCREKPKPQPALGHTGLRFTVSPGVSPPGNKVMADIHCIFSKPRNDQAEEAQETLTIGGWNSRFYNEIRYPIIFYTVWLTIARVWWSSVVIWTGYRTKCWNPWWKQDSIKYIKVPGLTVFTVQ